MRSRHFPSGGNRLIGLKSLHLSFLRECRAIGITASDYPFDTERMAIRALAATLRNEWRLLTT